MSTVVAERPCVLPASSAETGLDCRSGGGGLTLEQLLGSVWEGLHADGAAECPLCRGRMGRTAGGAQCGDCGSTLN